MCSPAGIGKGARLARPNAACSWLIGKDPLAQKSAHPKVSIRNILRILRPDLFMLLNRLQQRELLVHDLGYQLPAQVDYLAHASHVTLGGLCQELLVHDDDYGQLFSLALHRRQAHFLLHRKEDVSLVLPVGNWTASRFPRPPFRIARVSLSEPAVDFAFHGRTSYHGVFACEADKRIWRNLAGSLRVCHAAHPGLS